MATFSRTKPKAPLSATPVIKPKLDSTFAVRAMGGGMTPPPKTKKPADHSHSGPWTNTPPPGRKNKKELAMVPAAQSKLEIKTRRKKPSGFQKEAEYDGGWPPSDAFSPAALKDRWPKILQDLLILTQEYGYLPTPVQGGWLVPQDLHLSWTDSTLQYRQLALDADESEGEAPVASDYSGNLYIESNTIIPLELDPKRDYYWLENVVTTLKNRSSWIAAKLDWQGDKEQLIKKLKLQPHQLLLLQQKNP